MTIIEAQSQLLGINVMDGIFLLLGSNLGQRQSHLEQAKTHIEERAGRIVASSSIYETAAWGGAAKQAFLNQVLHIDSLHAPDHLLTCLLGIEAQMGRVRQERWGDRLIDIDLLYYQNLVFRSDFLQVPHPAITARRFTLVPLAEIAPDFIHPELQSNQKTLLEHCEDPLQVLRYATGT